MNEQTIKEKRKFVEKPNYLLKITGKLEIDFNDKTKTIKNFEIKAKDLNVLINKLSNEIIKEVSLDKRYSFLMITGKLEIDFNDKDKTIKNFEIEAIDLDILIKKLLNKITEVSLSKLQEALQFIIEKGSEK